MKTNTIKQTKSKLKTYILCAVLAVTALFSVITAVTFGGKNIQASAAGEKYDAPTVVFDSYNEQFNITSSYHGQRVMVLIKPYGASDFTQTIMQKPWGTETTLTISVAELYGFYDFSHTLTQISFKNASYQTILESDYSKIFECSGYGNSVQLQISDSKVIFGNTSQLQSSYSGSYNLSNIKVPLCLAGTTVRQILTYTDLVNGYAVSNLNYSAATGNYTLYIGSFERDDGTIFLQRRNGPTLPVSSGFTLDSQNKIISTNVISLNGTKDWKVDTEMKIYIYLENSNSVKICNTATFKENTSTATPLASRVVPIDLKLLVGAFVYSGNDGGKAEISINLKPLYDAGTLKGNTSYRFAIATSASADLTNNYTITAFSAFAISTPISLPADPVKAGYTFVGWFFDEALTQAYDGRPIYVDTALYAKFNPINYTIIYNLNSGTMSGQKTSYTIETATYTLPTPTRAGYTFGGWYESSNFSGTKVTQIAKGSMGNKTYYAQWTLLSYAIVYNLNGGTMTGQTTSFNVETATYTLPTPTRTGYTFGGWFTASNLSGTAVTQLAKGSTGDKTYYAKWDIVTYTITYNLNDGEQIGEITTYTYESGVVTLPTPTKIGHTFKGWFDNAAFTGSAIPSIGANSTGNKTYYAKWEINTYTVTFYVDGEIYKEVIVSYGSTLAELYLVNTETMQAVSFFMDSELRNSFNTLSIIDENLTVFTDSTFALYASLSYSVNGEIIATDLLSYNSQLSNLRDTVKEGYTFGGWYYDNEFTQAVKETDVLTSNTTIYAKLTEIVPEEVAEVTTWDKIWKVLKPILIYGGIGLGAILIVGVVIKIVKKRK